VKRGDGIVSIYCSSGFDNKQPDQGFWESSFRVDRDVMLKANVLDETMVK
jgi:hypothetical protein